MFDVFVTSNTDHLNNNGIIRKPKLRRKIIEDEKPICAILVARLWGLGTSLCK